jgi:small subunit ribosomal protein S27e
MPRYANLSLCSISTILMHLVCAGCFAITTVFSHAQTVVQCASCASVLCQPTGGRARLTEGVQHYYRCGCDPDGLT